MSAIRRALVVMAEASRRFASDAGLRLGEMLGLEQRDADFSRGQLEVQRAVYDKGRA